MKESFNNRKKINKVFFFEKKIMLIKKRKESFFNWDHVFSGIEAQDHQSHQFPSFLGKMLFSCCKDKKKSKDATRTEAPTDTPTAMPTSEDAAFESGLSKKRWINIFILYLYWPFFGFPFSFKK